MASRLLQRFSRLRVSSLVAAADRQHPSHLCPFAMDVRFFSNDNDDKKKSTDDNNISDDPFGVNYEDGEDHGKLGPKKDLPPRYVRDSATGKFTGKVEQDLTDEEQRMLDMDDIDRHQIITRRLVKQWNKPDEDGDSKHQQDVARRIREEDMALNTFGRSVDAQSTKGVTDDGDEAYEDEEGFSRPLSPNEFRSFRRFMEKEQGVEIEEDDIPVQQTRDASPNFTNADNPDLDMQWLTVAAQRVMSDEPDDPFVDLLPSDLNPARKVNNRKAKKIPRKLLHHNNLSFLRRYVTPSGQIMNRVQSRLGAKEQRKVAKLVKRARHLGLIPFVGQWKVTNHGNIYEKDIIEDREWEKELKQRGLVIRRRQKENETKSET